jgi:hypothetical protein
MQVLTLSLNLPIYLPYDKAPLPFGDPFSNATMTSAGPGVFTVPGYIPTNGDAIQLSVYGGATLDTAFAVGTTYYVVAAANDTFELSSTKGGAALNTHTTNLQTGGNLTVHLVSNQVDGTTQPFKSGASVLALNTSSTTAYLNGASDSNTSTTYGNPTGPGAYTQLASLAAGAAAVVTLQADWINVTGATKLVLLQN